MSHGKSWQSSIEWLEPTLTYLPLEERLKIRGVCKDWRNQVDKSWSQIRRLEIKPSNKKNNSYETQCYSNGLRLFCHKNERLIENCLKTFGKHLTHLEDSGHLLAYDSKILKIAARHCKKVKTLAASVRNLSDSRSLVSVMKKNQLSKVYLYCSSDNGAVTIPTDYVQLLEHAHVEISPYNDARASVRDIVVKMLSAPSLKTFQCNIVDSQIFKEIGNRSTLEELTITFRHATWVERRFLEPMLKLKYLRYLKLKKCTYPWIDDSFIFEIAHHFPLLEILEISDSSTIADSSLVPLAQLEHLRELSITGAPNIKGTFLEFFVTSERISVMNCPVNDDSLIQLVNRAESLVELDARGTQVTERLAETEIDEQNGVLEFIPSAHRLFSDSQLSLKLDNCFLVSFVLFLILHDNKVQKGLDKMMENNCEIDNENDITEQIECKRMKIRAPRMNQEQLDWIVDYMAAHSDFARDGDLGLNGHITKNNMWKNLTEQVCALGPAKTVTQVSTTWARMKQAAQEKFASYNKFRKITGNRAIPESMKLRDRDLKILEIWGTLPTVGLKNGTAGFKRMVAPGGSPERYPDQEQRSPPEFPRKRRASARTVNDKRLLNINKISETSQEGVKHMQDQTSAIVEYLPQIAAHLAVLPKLYDLFKQYLCRQGSNSDNLAEEIGATNSNGKPALPDAQMTDGDLEHQSAVRESTEEIFRSSPDEQSQETQAVRDCMNQQNAIMANKTIGDVIGEDATMTDNAEALKREKTEASPGTTLPITTFPKEEDIEVAESLGIEYITMEEWCLEDVETTAVIGG